MAALCAFWLSDEATFAYAHTSYDLLAIGMDPDHDMDMDMDMLSLCLLPLYGKDARGAVPTSATRSRSGAGRDAGQGSGGD